MTALLIYHLVFCLIALTLLFVFWKSPLIWGVAPLIVAFILCIWTTEFDLKSKPIEGWPHHKFLLVNYIAQSDKLYVWCRNFDAKSLSDPYTIVIPYTPEDAKNLGDQIEKLRQGQPIIGDPDSTQNEKSVPGRQGNPTMTFRSPNRLEVLPEKSDLR